MAKEEIVFEVSVDGTGSGAKSLKSLKAEFKQLQSELEKTEVGTKAYQQALEKLGNVRDEIGDLRDTISALNPEGKVQAFANVAGKLAGGFQAATGAAALFGVQSEELEKQLLKVQAATALAQGIQSVVGLADAFAVLKTTLMSLNPWFLGISAAVVAIGAAYKVWSENMSEAAKNDALLNNELERQAKNQEKINDELERNLQIDLLLAKSESERIKLELEAEVQRYAALRTRQILMNQIEEMDSEQREEKEKLDKEEADSYNRILILRLKLNKENREKEKKDTVETKKKEIQEVADLEKIALEQMASQRQADKAEEAELKREFDDVLRQLEAENLEADLTQYLDYEERKMQESLEIEKRGAAQKKEIDDQALKEKQLKAQREAEIQQNYFNAVSDLSTTYFNLEIAAAKGNEAKINELRKKQFNVEKALSATRATISAIESINKTLALGGPLSVPLAISIGVAGFANVAKILSQQYNSGATSTTATPNLNTGGVNIQTQAPNTGAIPLTRLNEQGQNLSAPVRAYVVETDVSESQQRVRRLEDQASF